MATMANYSIQRSSAFELQILNDGGGTLSKSLAELSVDELKCFIKLTYLLQRVTSPKVTVKTKRVESENESNIDTSL